MHGLQESLGEVLVATFSVNFILISAIRIASSTDCTGKRARQNDTVTIQLSIFVVRSAGFAVTGRLGWLKNRPLPTVRQ
jgi:hypothetical protein